jgi:hypothetical protein
MINDYHYYTLAYLIAAPIFGVAHWVFTVIAFALAVVWAAEAGRDV